MQTRNLHLSLGRSRLRSLHLACANRVWNDADDYEHKHFYDDYASALSRPKPNIMFGGENAPIIDHQLRPKEMSQDFAALRVVISIAVMFTALLAILWLTGCSDNNEPEHSPTLAAADPWAYSIPIAMDDPGYVWMDVAVDGTMLRCLFDSGAPGIWLPNPLDDSEVTVTTGNFTRANVLAYELAESDEWTGCLVGLPFFDATDYWIDVDAGELRIS